MLFSLFKGEQSISMEIVSAHPQAFALDRLTLVDDSTSVFSADFVQFSGRIVVTRNSNQQQQQQQATHHQQQFQAILAQFQEKERFLHQQLQTKWTENQGLQRQLAAVSKELHRLRLQQQQPETAPTTVRQQMLANETRQMQLQSTGGGNVHSVVVAAAAAAAQPHQAQPQAAATEAVPTLAVTADDDEANNKKRAAETSAEEPDGNKKSRKNKGIPAKGTDKSRGYFYRHCNADGCEKNAQQGGFCRRHGGGYRCRLDDCNGHTHGPNQLCLVHGGAKNCQADGCTRRQKPQSQFCAAHGGSRQCTVENCQNEQKSKGLCLKHLGTRKCHYPNCKSTPMAGAHSYKYCMKHGGGYTCRAAGCTKKSRGRHGTAAFCVSHGGSRPSRVPCRVEGCRTLAQARGYCSKHDPVQQCRQEGCDMVGIRPNMLCRVHGGVRKKSEGGKKLCQFEGCTSTMRKGGFCVKHGGGFRCQHDECMHGASGGTPFCVTHGGGNRCAVNGCNTAAVGASGLCTRHAGGGGGNSCKVDGCTKRSLASGLCTRHSAKQGGGTRGNICQADDCNIGVTGLFCSKHGGDQEEDERETDDEETCRKDGCENRAMARGLCIEHGGGPRCQHPDCDEPAAQKGGASIMRFCKAHGDESSSASGKLPSSISVEKENEQLV